MSKDKKQKPDAWKQADDLRRKYIRTWRFRKGAPMPMGPVDKYSPEIRRELEKHKLIVTADPLERCIRLNDGHFNVCTIREYIQILELACDWVEETNPNWASHEVELDPPEKFEYKR